MLFIIDASVGVATYMCIYIYVHSVLCITIRVGKAKVKSRRYQDPMAYMCVMFPVSYPAEYILRN